MVVSSESRSPSPPPIERIPLLPGGNDDHEESTAPDDEVLEVSAAKRLKVILPCLLILFLIAISHIMAEGPVAPILETLVCQAYYPDMLDPSTDPRCKSTAVAASLANVYSCQLLVAYLPSVVLSVPYGVMADRRGRKIVLLLSLLGLSLYFGFFSIIASFPGRLSYWLTIVVGLFFLIGGGPATATTMVYTMIADVTPTNQKATAFFYLNAATLCGFLMATPLLSWLLRRGNWLPFFIGLSGIVFCAFVALFLPETRNSAMLRKMKSFNSTANELESGKSTLDSFSSTLLSTFTSSFSAIREYCLGGNKRTAILLLAISFNIFGHDVVVISLMYTVKVFDLSWADATALSTVRIAMSLTVLLVILPLANQLLVNRFSITAARKDLLLARISIVLLAFGYFTQGLAPNIPLYIVTIVISSIGLGFPSLLRSLITASAGGDDLGTLYSMITVIENLGNLIASPAMLQLFGVGIEKGGYWRGLPFYFASGLLSLSMILVFVFRLPQQEEVSEGREPDPEVDSPEYS